jgi:predicted small secreted protein
MLSAALLGALALNLAGCAWLLGKDEDIKAGGAKVESPAEKVLDPVTSVGGIIGAVASGLLGLINVAQAVKAKKYKEGLDALVVGVDRAVEAGKQPAVSKEALYKALVEAVNEKCGDPEFIRSFIAKAKDIERN